MAANRKSPPLTEGGIPREGLPPSVFATVDDLLIDLFGKWCERCQQVTEPYVAEDWTWPCCNGCWWKYPDAEAHRGR